MKWTKIEPPEIPDGAIQTKTWFAWWPITIGRETRWLERVTVEFQYFAGYLTAMPCWTMRRFVN
jgi:hypothetical protein